MVWQCSNVVEEEKDLCFLHGASSSTSRTVNILLRENDEAESAVAQVQKEAGGNTGDGVDCHVKVD